MMESAASKANVKQHRSDNRNEISSRTEELHEKCYVELMETLTLLAEQFKLKTSSIMTVEVSTV